MRYNSLTPARCAHLCIFIFTIAAASPLGAGSLTTVSTLAGRSLLGCSDGTGSEVGFANPFGMAADAWGNVYVADTLNHTVRRISPDGVVTTIAGKAGAAGSTDGPGSQARFRSPKGIAVDRFGTIFLADGGNQTIRTISPAGEVRTIAGQVGAPGDADGIGSAAQFRVPMGLAIDATGILIVADSGNATIRSVSPSGEVRTLAGGAGEFGSDDGPAAVARFTQPVGVAVNGAGTIYVTDIATATIRAIDATGNVSTLAGKTRVVGSADGIGVNARFNSPRGIAVDGLGNIFVADSFNSTIRMIQPSGVVSTFAGLAGQGGDSDGAVHDARFNEPAAVAVSAGGSLYVSDVGAGTIRTIEAGMVYTLAGESSRGDRDGPATEARFNDPLGVAVDRQGTIYVADTANNTIREISPSGTVHIVAGKPGEGGDVDGPGETARFNSPHGIAVDWDGNIYVADEGNASIRRVAPDGTTVTVATRSAGLVRPTAVAVDALGDIFVADPARHTIDKIDPTGNLTIFAGSAFVRGSVDGAGTAAQFDDPYGLAIDNIGSIYVADLNGTIRKIAPDAVVTTFAGQPDSRKIVDGVGRAARFLGPNSLAVDDLGNLFVADGPATIRQITPAGRVITLAGKPGLVGGVNGRGEDARFALPGGIAVDRAAHLYIADSINNAIREADSATRLVNLSVRGRVGTADQTPIMGFVISKGAPKSVLVRSIGPSLVPFEVTGATKNPRLQLFDFSGHPTQENDDWGGTDPLRQLFATVGAFQLDPASKDAALSATLPFGLYTVHTAAANDAGGVALMEVYDADPDTEGRLINLSARTFAGTGDETLIAGFVLWGAMPKTVLLRVAGPSLAPLGVGASGLLLDPRLTLFQGSRYVADNDDWGATDELKTAFQTVGAFDFGSGADKDAALVATLQPGAYTVLATAATPGTGVALIEVYEVP